MPNKRAAAIKRKAKKSEAAASKDAAMMQALRILPSVASCNKNALRAVCSELRAGVDLTVTSAKPAVSATEVSKRRRSLHSTHLHALSKHLAIAQLHDRHELLLPTQLAAWLTSLDVAGVSDGQDLSTFTALKSLRLDPVFGVPEDAFINSISGLTALTRLECMRWDGYHATTALTLSSLVNLVELRWPMPLPQVVLPALRRLDLTNSDTSDLAVLSALVALTSLVLANDEGQWGDDVPRLDLHPLVLLTGLLALDLKQTRVDGIEPLALLTGLTSLVLKQCQDVLQDLRPLAALTALAMLDLTGVTSNDLRPLASLTALTSLVLASMVSEAEDIIGPLAALTALVMLDLTESDTEDLRPLAQLTRLTSLVLAEMHSLDDLTPLVGLTGLRSLNLSGSLSFRRVDYMPLRTLTGLTSLVLANTQISNLKPLAGLTALVALDLSGCQQLDEARVTAGTRRLVNLCNLSMP